MLAVNKSFLSPLRGWDARLSPAAPKLDRVCRAWHETREV